MMIIWIISRLAVDVVKHEFTRYIRHEKFICIRNIVGTDFGH